MGMPQNQVISYKAQKALIESDDLIKYIFLVSKEAVSFEGIRSGSYNKFGKVFEDQKIESSLDKMYNYGIIDHVKVPESKDLHYKSTPFANRETRPNIKI